MNKNAIEIVSTLKENGHEAVFAGGCVRDLLFKIEPKDIDIATSATPDEVEWLFKNTIPVGKQFGIVIVVIDNEQFEVATFRTDSKTSDGRRPDSVEFSSMEEDAKRRDLTINAMFLDPITNEVFDFVGGKEDIRNGVIRFVGNAEERIEEDKLRILRAIRFGAKFHFNFDEKTEDALFNNAHRVMGNVSVERIGQELEKMLLLPNPSHAFNALNRFGILKFILPEIDRLMFSPQSKKWHSEGNVYVHTMLVLNHARERTDDLITLWSALFHDVAKPHCIRVNEDGNISNYGHERLGAQTIFPEIAKRFKFSNKYTESISWLIENHMKPNIALEMKNAKLRKLMANDDFDRLLILCESDNEGSSPESPDIEDTKKDGLKFLKKLKDKAVKDGTLNLPKPFISGKDLIELGMNPGPHFKNILKDVFDMQLNGEVSNKEEALLSIQ